MNNLCVKKELEAKQALIDRIKNADLRELIDWSLETYDSEENKRRIENPSNCKFIIYLGRTVYGKILGFTQPDFFEDAEKSLTAQLRTKLFVHYVLEEDTPFNLNVGIELGTALEATLFGMEYEYPGTADPTYKNYPGGFLNELEDYKQLKMPDFYKSGWMPEAHRLYGELKKLNETYAGGRMDVYFPGWARGPWSMATILRGANNLLMDSIEDDELVGEFLMFLAEARIHFEKQRCEFLGIKPEDLEHRWTYCSYRYNYNSDCFEDEVDCKLFSAGINRNLIIPAQKRMSEFYNGISYYHSCGCLKNFLDDVAELNIRRYQHISPGSYEAYASFEEAYDKFDSVLAPEVVAQISLRSTDAIGVRDEARMEELLRDKIQAVKARTRVAEICADAIFAGSESDPEEVREMKLVENVMKWRNVFRKLDKEID